MLGYNDVVYEEERFVDQQFRPLATLPFLLDEISTASSDHSGSLNPLVK